MTQIGMFLAVIESMLNFCIEANHIQPNQKVIGFALLGHVNASLSQGQVILKEALVLMGIVRL